ncbi:MAG: argininosuccinate lyase [Victivallales bacterium]|nr:argininosuccinate lyase [Victivallales bacterium]MCF7889013.1 argininosuccinate lyase [Victivallales bacterium]
MALWDGRFSEKPTEALTEFSESISFDKRLYKHDIEGSKAHAEMLAEAEIIPRDSAEKIIKGLELVLSKIEENNFDYNAELEDIHMHIENALIAIVGDDGARLHTGRSRNDQIALDIRLYLREEILTVCEGIKEFQKALIGKAEEYKQTLLPGYTHLQRAQPVLFPHQLLAYTEMLERDIERLLDCRKRLNIMPLGSAALAGSTLPLKRNVTARLLNFDRISSNSMDAVADRDFLCELLSGFSIFAMHVSRISEDIILWCSEEFNYIELGDAFCTGSSIMPQKKNPDIAEISRGKTARIYGDLMSILTLLKGLPLTYNRDLQEDKEPVFDAVDNVKKILSVYPSMIASIMVKKENMLKAASDPALMATDLAEKLVELGVPFRIAHHRVGSLVKWCEKNKLKLDNITYEEMLSVIPEANEECLKLFNPEKSISKRNIYGATGYGEVDNQLNFWKKKLN